MEVGTYTIMIWFLIFFFWHWNVYFYFFVFLFFLTLESIKDSSLMFMFLYLGILISQKLLDVTEINPSLLEPISIHPFKEVRNILFDIMCHYIFIIFSLLNLKFAVFFFLRNWAEKRHLATTEIKSLCVHVQPD